ncbi:MAG: hypothetical protein ACM3IJ_04295 [Candidatus Levyibacteriota bacterium]
MGKTPESRKPYASSPEGNKPKRTREPGPATNMNQLAKEFGISSASIVQYVDRIPDIENRYHLTAGDIEKIRTYRNEVLESRRHLSKGTIASLARELGLYRSSVHDTAVKLGISTDHPTQEDLEVIRQYLNNFPRRKSRKQQSI